MARPRKPINYEEEIHKIELQIMRHQSTIEELEKQKEKLQQEKKNQEVSALYDALQVSGRSVEDIVAMLQPATEE